jgi:peptide/nickel transport system substrate-binding protein
VLLLTACGPVGDGDDSGISGSGGAVRDGGTITVALADDPDMLDPTLARTLVGRMVFMSMCEKLYDIDQKSLDRHCTLEGSQRKSELLAVTGVDMVDPATVRIRLSQPFAPL